MQKVVYISNSRDYTEQNDINDNKYLTRINSLLQDGWVIAQMNTQTVAVDPKLESSPPCPGRPLLGWFLPAGGICRQPQLVEKVQQKLGFFVHKR